MKPLGKDGQSAVTFLYLLMRDHVPTGTVAGLVKQVKELGGRELNVTNKELAAMAERYVREILGE